MSDFKIYASMPGKANKWWRRHENVSDWSDFVEWATAGETGGKTGRPFVPATFRDGKGGTKNRARRQNVTFVERYAITLDADNAGKGYIKLLREVAPVVWLSHTTASHGQPGKGERWRTIIPVSRPMNGLEAKAIATYFVNAMGEDRFDVPASVSPVAVAYAPAWKGCEFVENDGDVLDVDDWLMLAPDVEWSDKDDTRPSVDEFLAELPGTFECAYGRAALEGASTDLADTPDGSRHKAIYAAAARFVEMAQFGCWVAEDAAVLAGAAADCADDPRQGEAAFWEAVDSALKSGVGAESGCKEHADPDDVFGILPDESDPTRGVISGRISDTQLKKMRNRLLPSPDRPADVALEFLLDHVDPDVACVKLRTWQKSCYEWAVTKWVLIDDPTLLVDLQTYTANAVYVVTRADGSKLKLPWAPNDHKKRNLLNAIKATAGAYILPSVLPNSFFECGDGTCTVPDETARWLSFANGIFDTATDERMDHSPVFFNLTSRPYNFDLDAPEPQLWLKVLKDFWGHEDDGGEASIAAFQEQIGFLVFGRNSDRLKTIVVWQGEGDTGKSVCADVVAMLTGPGGVVGLAPKTFVDKFGREILIGAEVGMFAEADFTGVGRAAATMLKEISGFDHVNINKKSKGDFTGKLNARLAMVTNNVPRLDDPSGAINNRIQGSRFSRVFAEEEQDLELLEKLHTELTEIAMWALRGYKRALARGHLQMSPSGRGLAGEIAGSSSPLATFLDETVEPHGASRIASAELANLYAEWCEENGLDYAPDYLTPDAFSKAVKQVRPAMTTTVAKIDKKSTRAYVGWRLRE